MPQKPHRGSRLPSAPKLCRHFDRTVLARCARAGLDALEAEHKEIIVGGAHIACGVALDRCRQPHEPDANRWDYVFTVRGHDPDLADAIAVEVHHADAGEVSVMIAKKSW